MNNPLKYHIFLATFDEHVDRVSKDPGVKRTRLLQCTSGRARDSIRYCVLVGGEKGYLEAREILRRRFGSAHIISDRITKDLKTATGKQIRTN